jgi:hypothetical protein
MFRHHAADRPGPRPVCRDTRPGALAMTVHLQPVVALIAGILILIMPRLLNYIVAIYLIFIGVVGLFPHLVK